MGIIVDEYTVTMFCGIVVVIGAPGQSWSLSSLQSHV